MTESLKQGLGQATSGLWKDYVISSPDDNVWQQILDAIGLALSGILTGSGYKTDIGNNVFYDRPTDLSEAETPGIIYFSEAIGKGEGAAMGSFRWALPVSINILATGSTAKAIINQAVSDVLTVIGANPTWGGLAAISNQQPEVTPFKSQQQDHIVSGVNVKLTVIYDTARWEI